MSEKDLKRLGQAVKDRRGELGLSQEEFCRRADLDGKPTLSIKQLSRIEGGTVNPRAKTLAAIDRAAGWPTSTASRIVAGGPSPTDENDSITDPDRELRELLVKQLRAWRVSGRSRERVRKILDDVRAEFIAEGDGVDSNGEIVRPSG